MEQIKVDSIKVRDRHRKDVGDLLPLAESIKRIGLLQPVGVTKDNVLVFGFRRLLAYRDMLDRDEIPANVIDLDRVIDGEHDENAMRKDFTTSEQVAIKKAMAKRKRGGQSGESQNIAIQDEAAKKAGLGNRETAKQAETVVDKGVPELVQAMDDGAVSISAAAQVATLSEEEQRDVIDDGPTAVRAKAKEVRNKGKEKPKKKAKKAKPQTGESELSSGVMTAIETVKSLNKADLREFIAWLDIYVKGRT